jgi:hypothetical protein
MKIYLHIALLSVPLLMCFGVAAGNGATIEYLRD